ncbi:MAG: pilus assembly protein PilM [Deltaproteobacteria bacterium]|nr:pilus assembly protein PilM [Deltaproteobacteria bacterium]
MAQIVGIDLGSHSVKVAVLDAGLRAMTVRSVRRLEVLGGAEPVLERSLAALQSLSADVAQTQDGLTVGVPGDQVLMRVLALPFTDPRKVVAIIGGELGDTLPWEIEEVVFDHRALPTPAPRLIAAAARTETVQQLLQGLRERGLEPRHLAVTPLAYSALLRRIDPEGQACVVDIGHFRTNVCLVSSGQALVGRSISRAGHQLTEALRRSFQWSYAEAAAFKEQRAAVCIDGDEHAQRVALLLERALLPLAREIRHSIDVLGAQVGMRPQRIYLCGGSSMLSGIDRFIEREVGLSCDRLSLAADAELASGGLSGEAESVSMLSIGLALEHGRRSALDLRQGPFAFKADSSIWRDKWRFITISAVLILVAALLNTMASLHALGAEEEMLRRRMRLATMRIFGRPMMNPRQVMRRLKQTTDRGASLPSRTALDVFSMISSAVPAKDKIKLDVNQLDIKPGKTYLKGTADSRAALGEMVAAFKSLDCFKTVETGKTSRVGDGKIQFSMNIATKCF